MRLGVMAILILVACGDDPSSLHGTRTTQSAPIDGDSADPSTPSTPTNPDPVVNDGSPAQTCVDTINGYRKQQGLPALERWTAQESCADGQASKDGSSSDAHGAFGKCQESSQNECPGWPGAPESMIKDCLDAMWSQGPGEGHHDNMASKQWKRVACGFANGKGGVWSVQNFQ